MEYNEILLAFTAGIPDALNSDTISFGDACLSDLLIKGGSTPALLISGIEKKLCQFIGTADQFDDIMMLAVQRTGE